MWWKMLCHIREGVGEGVGNWFDVNVRRVIGLLEQGCFTSHLLSFDNNKVLKIINWIC